MEGMSSEELLEISRLLHHLKVDGWCVIRGVIPVEALAPICQAVLTLEERQRSERQAMVARMRAAAHRVGAEGVGVAQGIIGAIPVVAGYLADRRVLEVAQAFFGPHVRVSTVSALINFPGNERGYWHADWPYNQTFEARIPAPYPDAVMHLSSLFMLTRFSAETGGTLVVPGSHRAPNNPTGNNGVDPLAPYPTEMNVTGEPGDVLLFDSRLWHSVAPNRSPSPRLAISVRYAPWWLNLEVRRKGSPDHELFVIESNGKDNSVPLIAREDFDALPEQAKSLFRHWVER